MSELRTTGDWSGLSAGPRLPILCERKRSGPEICPRHKNQTGLVPQFRIYLLKRTAIVKKVELLLLGKKERCLKLYAFLDMITFNERSIKVYAFVS